MSSVKYNFSQNNTDYRFISEILPDSFAFIGYWIRNFAKDYKTGISTIVAGSESSWITITEAKRMLGFVVYMHAKYASVFDRNKKTTYQNNSSCNKRRLYKLGLQLIFPQ